MRSRIATAIGIAALAGAIQRTTDDEELERITVKVETPPLISIDPPRREIAPAERQLDARDHERIAAAQAKRDRRAARRKQ